MLINCVSVSARQLVGSVRVPFADIISYNHHRCWKKTQISYVV